MRRIVIAFVLCVASAFHSARAQSAGLFDRTFNGSGVAVAPIEGVNLTVVDLAIQPDGKIVSVGYVSNGVGYRLAVVRFLPGGALDPTFDGDGKVITEIRGRNDYAAAVAIQTDGKIVVGGSAAHELWFDFALVRYNSDGSLDESFGQSGKVTTQVGFWYSTIRSVAIQPDGKIVAVGDGFGDERDIAVVRYLKNGALDTTFGNGGIRMLPIDPGASESGAAAAVQNDGKILVTGAVVGGVTRAPELASTFVVARLDRRGQLDDSFGNHGIVLRNFGGEYQQAGGITVLPDQRILVGGAFGDVSGTKGLLVRMMENGTPDPTFDDDGFRPFLDGTAGSQLAQPDGRILVSRTFGTFPNTFAGVTRINSDGQIDPGFGVDGNFVGHGGVSALQTDGKIVLGGTFSGQFKVVRLTGDSPIPPHAGIQGRLLGPNARGLAYGLVRVRNTATNQIFMSITNPFGYFHFGKLDTDQTYELSVSHKRFQFSGDNQVFRLLGDRNGVVLYADE